MATINLGRVGFVQKGTYSGVTAYKINDVVVYNNGVYACISPTTGNLPTNTTHWKLWLDPSTLVAKTGDETITGVKTFSSNTIFNGDVMQNTLGTSNIYIRNLLGYNRIDSYNDPITGTYPLIINSSRFILQIGDSNALLIDDNKNVLVSSGGLGYAPGAGGTVTQLTSKSTSVTLNKPSGQITMNSESLAAGACVTFGVANSLVTTSDNIIVSHQSAGAGNGTYSVGVDSIGTGAFGIYVKNTGAASLSEAIVLNFTIIKGANS